MRSTKPHFEPYDVTVPEVSTMTGMSERLIRDMADAGEIPALVHTGAQGKRTRRFRRSDVEAWIAANTTKQAT